MSHMPWLGWAASTNCIRPDRRAGKGSAPHMHDGGFPASASEIGTQTSSASRTVAGVQVKLGF